MGNLRCRFGLMLLRYIKDLQSKNRKAYPMNRLLLTPQEECAIVNALSFAMAHREMEKHLWAARAQADPSNATLQSLAKMAAQDWAQTESALQAMALKNQRERAKANQD